MLSWLCCHGYAVMVMLSWLCCHGFAVIVMLSWWCCRGYAVMVMLSWLCCHGYGVKVRLSWLCCHGLLIPVQSLVRRKACSWRLKSTVETSGGDLFLSFLFLLVYFLRFLLFSMCGRAPTSIFDSFRIHFQCYEYSLILLTYFNVPCLCLSVLDPIFLFLNDYFL